VEASADETMALQSHEAKRRFEVILRTLRTETSRHVCKHQREVPGTLSHDGRCFLRTRYSPILAGGFASQRTPGDLHLIFKMQATLAKQIAEEARAHDWLLRLQVTVAITSELHCVLKTRQA